jgi:hypothetical protein
VRQQHLTHGLRQADPVGLHAQVERGDRTDRGAQPRQDAVQAVRAHQQRLAAVQHDPDLAQAVPDRVLGDALGGGPHRGLGHLARPSPPGLVGVLVDVTVIAGQIAAAVHLQHELPQRRGLPRWRS